MPAILARHCTHPSVVEVFSSLFVVKHINVHVDDISTVFRLCDIHDAGRVGSPRKKEDVRRCNGELQVHRRLSHGMLWYKIGAVEQCQVRWDVQSMAMMMM